MHFVLCNCYAAGHVRKLAEIQNISEEAQMLHRLSLSRINHLVSLSPASFHVACQFVKQTGK